MIPALGNRGNTPVWSEGDFQNMRCGTEQRRRGKSMKAFFICQKKKKKGTLGGSCVSAVCGRVSKVADRVKGVKRGGWTLNGTRSDTKEPCRLSKRCQNSGRSRKIKNISTKGEVHQSTFVYLWDLETDSCIQAHTHPCHALCLPFTWTKTCLMPQLQFCLQGKDALGWKGSAGHRLCPVWVSEQHYPPHAASSTHHSTSSERGSVSFLLWSTRSCMWLLQLSISLQVGSLSLRLARPGTNNVRLHKQRCFFHSMLEYGLFDFHCQKISFCSPQNSSKLPGWVCLVLY